MKKVMLVLLLFGMVFGGVYGENVFVGQYSSEGEYTSIFYDSSSLSFTTSYDQAEIYADSYADLITEIYSVNNGNSITVISSGTKYYADESTKKIEFTYKDNQFYFTDESIEILKSGSPVDTDEYKINRNLDEMGFSNDDKLTVFEDVTSNVLPQRSPSTVSIPADVNTQQIEEVNEDNQLIFYDSNGDDIDDEIITLDFSDRSKFIYRNRIKWKKIWF